MTNTEALLSQYGVSFSDARAFIYSNLDNPLVIYDTAAQFNVTYDMLAELYGQQVTGAVVREFFSSYNLTTSNDTPDTGQVATTTHASDAAANLTQEVGALNLSDLSSMEELLAGFDSYSKLITEFTQDTAGQATPSLDGLGLENMFIALFGALSQLGLSGEDLSALDPASVNLPNVDLSKLGSALGSEADIIALVNNLTGNDANSALQDLITALAGAVDTSIPLNANEAALTGIPNIAANDFI